MNDLDPTGAVSDGFLRVLGAVATCKLVITNKSGGDKYSACPKGTSMRLTFSADDPVFPRWTEQTTLHCLAMGQGYYSKAHHS